MKQVLVTGANGFLGRHLLEKLASSWKIIGATRSAKPQLATVEWLRIRDETHGLGDAVGSSRPDLVIHAAFINRIEPGQSNLDYLSRQLTTNLQLFERCADLEIPLILISSSAVFGTSTKSTPMREDTAIRPVSLYGLAKAQQEQLAFYAARAKGLEICTARLFNLVGPGNGAGTVVHDWVKQVAAIAAGGEPILRVHNRATSRDFVDVRDAARAVAMLAEDFRPGETYNVASGESVSLIELSRYIESLCPVPYETIESAPRPDAGDAECQRGSYGKIREAFGWHPRISWRQSVEDVWDGYRTQ